MGWKKMPTWLKGGILSTVIALTLFVLGGIIITIINGGDCETLPCSAGSGTCTVSLEGCFDTYKNPGAMILEIPEGLVFYTTPFMNDFYGIRISHLFDFFDRKLDYKFPMQLIQSVVINLILYFLFGSIIGLIIQKIKSRKNNKIRAIKSN